MRAVKLRAAGFLLPAALLALGALGPIAVLADTNAQVAAALTANDVYISKSMPASAHVSPGDAQRLMDQTRAAVNAGVPEKIALVSHYPSNYSDTYAAAQGLRQFLDFAGALILVSPRGIGISSDTLTLGEIQTIERKARPRCLSSYAGCAVYAGQLAVDQTKADKAAANKSAAVTWLILLVVLGAIIAATVFVVRRRQTRTVGNPPTPPVPAPKAAKPVEKVPAAKPAPPAKPEKSLDLDALSAASRRWPSRARRSRLRRQGPGPARDRAAGAAGRRHRELRRGA